METINGTNVTEPANNTIEPSRVFPVSSNVGTCQILYGKMSLYYTMNSVSETEWMFTVYLAPTGTCGPFSIYVDAKAIAEQQCTVVPIPAALLVNGTSPIGNDNYLLAWLS